MQAKLDLTVSQQQLLQSFNEQLGDTLKDINHYSEDGECLYKSSKYVDRLVDAAIKLNKEVPAIQLGGEVGCLGAASAELLPVRKAENQPYKSMSPKEKSDLAVKIAQGRGIQGRGGLKDKVKTVGLNINSIARA